MMTMKHKVVMGVVAAAVVIVLAVLSSGFYTVGMTEFAVVTQFGRPVRTVDEAGLHWKNPFTQKANRIEKRILAWDGDPNDVITLDKKNIFIDTWARWRVVDPRKFFESLEGRIAFGQKKLDDIVDGVVRDVIAEHKLNELVRSSNRKLLYEEEMEDVRAGQRSELPTVEIGRARIVRLIIEQAGSGLKENFGMELVEVGIKRVNYIAEVRPAIYKRMSSERQRISSRFESEGQEQASIIQGDMRKELADIEGNAAKQTAEIRGEADARAIAIYADAIRKTRDFYEFTRTLAAYEKVFDRNTLVILSTDSRLLRLLKKDDLVQEE